MRARRKKTFEGQQPEDEGAQMSNELESDRAMAMSLEGLGVDGAGYDEASPQAT